ncbi:hypothetical protein LCGC14_2907190, partial [marine sediment metagenome]
MLQLVDIGRQSIDAYTEIAGPEIIEELREVAKHLQGLRVVHINATAYGGGVSELLRSLVPLEKDLGLDAEWRIIFGEEAFFKVTKKIHDALQGGKNDLSAAEKETFLNYNLINARKLDSKNYDVIIIHDPQPAALREIINHHESIKWV